MPKVKHVLVAGVAAGIVGGLVKLGWENLLPPRTPARNATNPPQRLLEQLGVPASVTHATYTYSEQQIPYVSLLMHFGFSITFALAYQVLGRRMPILKVGQGTLFGLGVWGAYHAVLMPMMGTIPSVKDQPIEEHVSEILGHMVWMWSVDRVEVAMKK
ncbi:DUF1440 domain-containing protein [Lacticaseibacillus brantae]|uniref:Periplasmic secreted protein n=1 Tax=Lacticaseibacillus brantae DSM 23927 TaxID=1423727 RepID=A0A0R2B6S9_9LACO|nr:DUF1440 domain-containing protein [Lacticaseibacillus brantae]KRM71798.1 hypothetical protein FC34_GL001459 [Lacticaseibacillus brantae DSM 23927]